MAMQEDEIVGGRKVACDDRLFMECETEADHQRRIQASRSVDEMLDGYVFTLPEWGGWSLRLNASYYSPNRYEVHGTPDFGRYAGLEIDFIDNCRLSDLHSRLDDFQASCPPDLMISELPRLRIPDWILETINRHHENTMMGRLIPRQYCDL